MIQGVHFMIRPRKTHIPHCAVGKAPMQLRRKKPQHSTSFQMYLPAARKTYHAHHALRRNSAGRSWRWLRCAWADASTHGVSSRDNVATTTTIKRPRPRGYDRTHVSSRRLFLGSFRKIFLTFRGDCDRYWPLCNYYPSTVGASLTGVERL